MALIAVRLLHIVSSMLSASHIVTLAVISPEEIGDILMFRDKKISKYGALGGSTYDIQWCYTCIVNEIKYGNRVRTDTKIRDENLD
jgi:hypothetical protein